MYAQKLATEVLNGNGQADQADKITSEAKAGG
jgi:hypothetical protein